MATGRDHFEPTETSEPTMFARPPHPADLARDADLRLQAVQRLRFMSIQHAMHAWDHRYDDPIAPHGVAFLFAQPAQQPDWHSLHAATRLWLAGPEARDLPRLLYQFASAVTERTGDPGFDLRSELANRTDPEMADDAWYVGLGVTSLDTRTGTWEKACRRAGSHMEIPSVIRITLIDSTVVVGDRRGSNEFNAMSVKATQPLSVGGLDSPIPWSGVDPAVVRSDPEHASVLPWMEELNTVLWQADNTRLLSQRGRT